MNAIKLWIKKWLGIQDEIDRMQETIIWMNVKIKKSDQQRDMMSEKIKSLSKKLKQWS